VVGLPARSHQSLRRSRRILLPRSRQRWRRRKSERKRPRGFRTRRHWVSSFQARRPWADSFRTRRHWLNKLDLKPVAQGINLNQLATEIVKALPPGWEARIADAAKPKQLRSHLRVERPGGSERARAVLAQRSRVVTDMRFVAADSIAENVVAATARRGRTRGSGRSPWGHARMARGGAWAEWSLH